ncbi:MAG: hypothetical protein IJE97_05820, partial [Thermoguttaceae bacterium]|nr:hypothetical protein [Thermoguttaceae bacterium]
VFSDYSEETGVGVPKKFKLAPRSTDIKVTVDAIIVKIGMLRGKNEFFRVFALRFLDAKRRRRL